MYLKKRNHHTVSRCPWSWLTECHMKKINYKPFVENQK